MSNFPAMLSANPWLNWNATISLIKPESPGVATYELQLSDADVASAYTFRPGQFNMIYLPGIGEVAISISGSPSAFAPSAACAKRGGLLHTIREAGNVTRALAAMKVGDSLGLRGPFGSAWPVEGCSGKDVILVAGGIGMAPLRPVVYELLANRESFGEVSLLLGARTEDGLLYSDELEDWGKSINVQRTVDRATSHWNGHVGVVTALLERLPIPRPEQTVLFTCGPEVMMWYTIRTALNCGLDQTSVWVSLERNMNCAIGLCGHCQLGPEFVCKDGPIFRYDRVASILKVESL